MRRVPRGSRIATCGKSGLASASTSVPGTAGYIPSAPKTHHALMVPPSSLPDSPSGPGPYSSSSALRTTFWARSGRPSQSYSQGVPRFGSLLRKACSDFGPAFSSVKKPSRRASAASRPPIDANSPFGSCGTSHEY